MKNTAAAIQIFDVRTATIAVVTEIPAYGMEITAGGAEIHAVGTKTTPVQLETTAVGMEIIAVCTKRFAVYNNHTADRMVNPNINVSQHNSPTLD